ncbi:hypothetical protein HDV00_004995 [Rhizophlyctis rosea]|nr:hypothetical protein HDV00_004995 [Rhizophlyctis rosea]
MSQHKVLTDLHDQQRTVTGSFGKLRPSKSAHDITTPPTLQIPTEPLPTSKPESEPTTIDKLMKRRSSQMFFGTVFDTEARRARRASIASGQLPIFGVEIGGGEGSGGAGGSVPGAVVGNGASDAGRDRTIEATSAPNLHTSTPPTLPPKPKPKTPSPPNTPPNPAPPTTVDTLSPSPHSAPNTAPASPQPRSTRSRSTQENDAERVERIAYLIRKFKEESVAAAAAGGGTGATVIPRRGDSYGVSGRKKERERGESAVSQGDGEGKGKAEGTGEEKAGGEGEEEVPESPIITVTPVEGDDRVIGATDSGENVGTVSSEVAAGGGEGDTPAASSALSKVDEDEKAVEDGVVAPPAGKGSYKHMEPETFGRLLFDLAVPGVDVDGVCLIIGKADEYHQKALASYMACFDFSEMSLDDGFRAMTSHLYLAGETQMVDRILFAFSKRWLECNEELKSLFRSVDVVYGILFSLVLLNTDLHIANVSTPSRKMKKATFVANTWGYIEILLKDGGGEEGDAEEKEGEEKVEKGEWLGTEEGKKWRKEIEGVLRDLYTSISQKRIIQRSKSDSPTSIAPASDSQSVHSNSSPTTPLHALKRGESTMSIQSSISSNTTFSTASGLNRAKGASILFRKKDSRPLFGTWSDPTSSSTSPSTPPPASLGSADNLSSSPTSLHPSPPQRSSTSTISASSDLHVEGLLIRKHVKEGEDKARNRRWQKVWCLVCSDSERGVEMVCWKVEGVEPPAVDGGNVGAAGSRETLGGGDTHGGAEEEEGLYGLEKGGVGTADPSGVARSSEGRKTVKFSPSPPETFNLLHCHCTIIPAPGYSDLRPHVFILRLSNNHTYYFHAPSAESVRAWVRVVTYWSARRSKEPLKGGVGSMEYGWGVVARELEDKGKSGAEGAADVGKDKKGEARKVKVVEWTPPGGLGMVVSSLQEDQQLHSMRRQLEHVERELVSHNALQPHIIEYFSAAPTQKVKALNNWARKQRYLLEEVDKYRGYVSVLRMFGRRGWRRSGVGGAGTLERGTLRREGGGEEKDVEKGKETVVEGGTKLEVEENGKEVAAAEVTAEGESLGVVPEEDGGTADGEVVAEGGPSAANTSIDVADGSLVSTDIPHKAVNPTAESISPSDVPSHTEAGGEATDGDEDGADEAADLVDITTLSRGKVSWDDDVADEDEESRARRAKGRESWVRALNVDEVHGEDESDVGTDVGSSVC